jgi:hypothetical protein
MRTPEEQYNTDVKAILAQYPKGSEERAEAKGALWDKYQADKGDVEVIHRHQKILATDLCNIVIAFHEGKTLEKDYGPSRTAAFQDYAARIVDLGLATEVPSDKWVAPYTEDALEFERNLLERGSIEEKAGGMTDAEVIFINDPLRDKCTEVLHAFHVQFGLGMLRDHPHTYGGVVPECVQEERKR